MKINSYPKKISLVLPLFNEEKMIPLLRDSLVGLMKKINSSYELILINDGSSDLTEQMLNTWSEKDSQVKVVHLSRNFGHQMAITAGLDHVSDNSEVIIVMDADLQDPPELVLKMIEEYQKGFDVVYAQRLSRSGEGVWKKSTAKIFYWIMNKLVNLNLPQNVGDFRLMSRRSFLELRKMREKHRYMRGMISWVGFNQTSVLFDRPARPEGESKYTLLKMLRLGLHAIISFSTIPLRLVSLMGLFVSLFGFIYSIWSVYRHYSGSTVPGWTTLVILLCFIGGAILIGMGVLGEYVAKIYEEIKGRPLYIVRESRNMDVDLVIK